MVVPVVCKLTSWGQCDNVPAWGPHNEIKKSRRRTLRLSSVYLTLFSQIGKAIHLFILIISKSMGFYIDFPLALFKWCMSYIEMYNVCTYFCWVFGFPVNSNRGVTKQFHARSGGKESQNSDPLGFSFCLPNVGYCCPVLCSSERVVTGK